MFDQAVKDNKCPSIIISSSSSTSAATANHSSFHNHHDPAQPKQDETAKIIPHTLPKNTDQQSCSDLC